MKNFTFCNPTRLIFGKDSLKRLRENIPSDSTILLAYGHGSIKKNGIYDAVCKELEGLTIIPFGGIDANPDASTIDEAVSVVRRSGCNFILAVGGGSVIDASKVIALGAKADMSAWDMVTQGYTGPSLPLGVVLTVPATGSEMNSGAVISNRATEEKFSVVAHHPLFSILDPTFTYTLSRHQLACGLADIFMHILEQYLTFPGQSGVMDRLSEGLLLNLLDIAPKVMSGEKDYDVACEYMLSATFALNYSLSMGIEQDWMTHRIGHEITALTGVTHGASLMMILPSVLRVMKSEKQGKIIQMGERVFGIKQKSTPQMVEDTIKAVECFIHSLGLAASLNEGGCDPTVVETVAKRFEKRGVAVGTLGTGTPEKVRKVLEQSIK